MSTWYTRVAEPLTVLAFTVTGFTPLAAVIAKLSAFATATGALATVPTGKGVGSSIELAALQPVALAGSPQMT